MEWHKMTIRLRPETYNAVLEKSQHWGLTPAETVRAIVERRPLSAATAETIYINDAMGERIEKLLQDVLNEVRACRTELNRIGCNLNQLAHLQHLRRLSENTKSYYEQKDYENKIAVIENQMAQSSDLKQVSFLINKLNDSARMMGQVIAWLRT